MAITPNRHRKTSISIIISLVTMVLASVPAGSSAQSWNFIKEKDGIKIYTRKEPGKELKSYKGTADIKAPAEKVFALLEDVYHTEWWDKNFSQIKVLQYEKYKHAQYYLVYDLPWPVTDRDLTVDVISSYDPAAGVGTITARPWMEGMKPQNDLVRIKDYRQTWTVKSLGPQLSQVLLEGYLDPAGSIPDWLSNMLIVDSPLKVIGNVRQQLEKN